MPVDQLVLFVSGYNPITCFTHLKLTVKACDPCGCPSQAWHHPPLTYQLPAMCHQLVSCRPMIQTCTTPDVPTHSSLNILLMPIFRNHGTDLTRFSSRVQIQSTSPGASLQRGLPTQPFQPCPPAASLQSHQASGCRWCPHLPSVAWDRRDML